MFEFVRGFHSRTQRGPLLLLWQDTSTPEEDHMHVALVYEFCVRLPGNKCCGVFSVVQPVRLGEVLLPPQDPAAPDDEVGLSEYETRLAEFKDAYSDESVQYDCTQGSSARAVQRVAERYGYAVVGVVRFLDIILVRKEVLQNACREGSRAMETVKEVGGLPLEEIRAACEAYFEIPKFEEFFQDLGEELRLSHAWPINRWAVPPLRKEIVDYDTLIQSKNVTKAHLMARIKLRMRDQVYCFREVYPTLTLPR